MTLVAIIAALSSVMIPSTATAIHYPPGSSCYDCHSIASGSMVAGTHLIKNSQKISDLGFSGGSLPCLFCHEQYAVSVTNRTTMLGVKEHFGSNFLSKHPVALDSTFGSSSTNALDCQSCHNGAAISTYVDPTDPDDGSPSNPSIHGITPGVDSVSIEATLAGNPANLTPAALDVTCNNCHNTTAPVSVNGLTAVMQHAWGANESLTMADGNAPAGCNSCHAGHGAPNSDKLLVFSDAAGDEIAYNLQKTDCEGCHVQDENGTATSAFTDAGHGKSGIGFECTTCHGRNHGDAAGSADFDKTDTDAAQDARMRFSLSDPGTPTSTISSVSAPSICQSCHGEKPLHYGDTPSYVGCRDCHDQHGTTVVDGTDTNDKMVRLVVNSENTNLPTGRVNPYSGWANPSNVADAGLDSTGICDNAACHPSLTTGLWGEHAGGDSSLQANSDCYDGQGCHTSHDEADDKNGESFGSSGCSGCHGGGTTGATAANYWPDNVLNSNPENDEPGRHQEHVIALAARFWDITTVAGLLDDAASPDKQMQICAYCHEDPSGVHFEGPTTTKHKNATVEVEMKALWDAYATDFAGSDGDSGYTDDAAGTCASMNCHNNTPSTVTASAGTGFGWFQDSTAECAMCHDKGTTLTSGLHAVNGANMITGVVHDDTLMAGGCTDCHVSLPDIKSSTSTHANGGSLAPDVGNVENGLYADYVDADPGPGTCSTGAANIIGFTTCHTTPTMDGGTWTRRWSNTADDQNGNECENCHGWFGDWETGDTLVRPAGVGPGALTGNHDSNWDGDGIPSELGGNHNGCLSCHGTTKGASHANYVEGTAFWNPTNASMHGDNKIQLGGPSVDDDGQGGPIGTGYNANLDASTEASDFACDVTCHQNNADHNMGDATGAGEFEYQDFGEPSPGNCWDCHGDEDNAGAGGIYPNTTDATNGLDYPNRDGLHTLHITAIVNGPGSFSATDASTCPLCHPSGSGDASHIEYTLANDRWDMSYTWTTHKPDKSADLNHFSAEPFKTIDGVAESDGDSATTSAPGGDAQYGNGSAVDDEVTCSNIDCHYEATPPNTSWYAGYTMGCGDCHKTTNEAGIGLVMSGAHDVHSDSSGYGYACSQCHPNFAGNNAHQDNALDMSFTSVTGANGSESLSGTAAAFNFTADATACDNFYCHGEDNVGAQTMGSGTDTDPVWSTPATGDCGTCHFDRTTDSVVSSRHDGHPDGTSYITQTNCTDCHADVTVTTTDHVNGTMGEIDLTSEISVFGAAAGTCTNTCHLVEDNNGDWDDGAPLPCVKCHVSGSYIGSGANLQFSGLHANSPGPTVSGASHDETLPGGCEYCHASIATTVNTSDAHIDGTMEAEGSNNEGGIQPRGLPAGYNEGAANASTCTGAWVGDAFSCHGDNGGPGTGGDNGEWARIWSTTAYLSDGSECANCHGGYVDTGGGIFDFTFGNDSNTADGATSHNYNWDGDADANNPEIVDPVSLHGQCKSCHGMNTAADAEAAYTVGTFWGGGSMHGDGQIQMNGSDSNVVGTEYSETTSLCSAACHTGGANTNHNMEDSGWTVDGQDFGAGSCGACHSAHGGSLPPNSFSHAAHINKNGGTGEGDVSDCIACHGDNSGQGFGAAHGGNGIQFDGAYITSTSGSGGTTTCNTSCHPTTAGQAATWNNTTTPLGCNGCHYTDAGTQTLTTSHVAHLSAGKGCVYCHGSPLPADNTHATSTGADDGAALVNMATPADGEANPTFAGATTTYTYTGSNNTCSSPSNNGLGCHATASSVTNGIFDWDVATSADNCIECHTNTTNTNVNHTSGLHAPNPTISGVAHDETILNGCEGCHTGIAGTGNHMDGTFQPNDAGLTDEYTDGSPGSCSNNTAGVVGAAGCHDAPGEAGTWKRLWDATISYDADSSSSSPACDGCHPNNVTDLANNASFGTEHLSAGHSCEDCHLYDSTSGAQHLDDFLTLNDNAPGDNCSEDSVPTADSSPVGVYCAGGSGGCHTSNHDAAHTSPRTDGTYWGTSPSTASDLGAIAEVGVTDACISGGHPANTCLGCHNNPVGARRGVQSEFNGTFESFHVQDASGGGTLADADKNRACYMCHAEESTAGGGGTTGTVQLKVWNSGGAVTDSTLANNTVSKNYDVYVWNPASGTFREDATTFCVGCHGPYMKGVQVFMAVGGGGDPHTPEAKSWDGIDIDSKYGVTTPRGNAAWSPYDSNNYNVTPAAHVLKAYSAHGNVASNHGGYAVGAGNDPTARPLGEWADRVNGTGGGSSARSGTSDVQCIDCHNVHASNSVTERQWRIDWDASPYNGTGTGGTQAATVPAEHKVGGLLAASSGSGGASSWHGTYELGNGTIAGSGTLDASLRPGYLSGYSKEADLCWDCHLGDDASAPKDYTDYGLTAGMSVFHHWDGTGRWGSWDTRTYSYKLANSADTMSIHFKTKANSNYDVGTTSTHPDGAGKGQCTPCHDPHGVTTKTGVSFIGQGGQNAPMFPLLKGNWLTSPWKEDAVPTDTEYGTPSVDYGGGSTYVEQISGRANAPQKNHNPSLPAGHGLPRENPHPNYNNPAAVGGGWGTGITGTGYGKGGNGWPGFFVDQNTFELDFTQPYWHTTGMAWGEGPLLNDPGGPIGGGATYENHSGICSVCHPDTQLDTGTTVGSLNSIHNTVRGMRVNTWPAQTAHIAQVVSFVRMSKLWNKGVRTAGYAPHGVGGGGDPTGESKVENSGNNYDDSSNYSNTTVLDDKKFWGEYPWPLNPNTFDTHNPHSYSCSKCHRMHSSSLPRLMKTNCLESSHLDISKVPRRSAQSGTLTIDTQTMVCHGEDYNTQWNNVTPWDGTAGPHGVQLNWSRN